MVSANSGLIHHHNAPTVLDRILELSSCSASYTLNGSNIYVVSILTPHSLMGHGESKKIVVLGAGEMSGLLHQILSSESQLIISSNQA